MELLQIINSYIKYIYLLVGIGIVIALNCVLFKGIVPLIKSLEKMSKSIDTINNDLDVLNKDIEKIEYTLNNSLPLFIDIAFVLFLIKSIFSDFSKTKRSKRSLFKSVLLQYEYFNLKYKHQFSNNTRLEFSKILNTIKTIQNN